MSTVILGSLLLFTLSSRGSAFLHTPDTDQGWSGGGEDIVRPQQKDHPEEQPWSPSLQREMTRMTGKEQSQQTILGDVAPVGSEQWRSMEALVPLQKEERPSVPIEEELSQKTRAQLDTLARSAHLAQPRFGLDTPLDPLASSSSLKYLHEGDLLKLRLILENLTLEGLSSLSVQEVTFQRGSGEEEEEEGELGRLQHGNDDDDDATADAHSTSGMHRGRRNGRRTASSKGLVRAAFSQVVVRAKYQVRGSAGGFLTFREGGNLTLTAPTVFLTSHLGLILPPPPPLSSPRPPTTPHRRHGGRVKVVRVRSEVSTTPPTLTIQPAAHPPKWVREQVQTKLEELSRDLSHGHGAVRRLLHLWGKLLKRLIHRTARTIA